MIDRCGYMNSVCVSLDPNVKSIVVLLQRYMRLLCPFNL